MKTVTLTYHDVVRDNRFSASGFQSPDANIYKLDETEFRRHLRVIARHAAPESCELVLTFDDGGAGAMYAADGIEQFGWRGYFFIPTDRLGSPGFLDEGQVRGLRRRGHLIGSHSCSHPIRMSRCTAAELDREWRESVRVLEQILGEPVAAASVPGGYYQRRVAAAAARAGIRTLFTSEPVISSSVIDGCAVRGRFGVQQGTSEPWLAAVVAGRRWPRWQSYLFWNGKKVLKAAGGTVWLRLRAGILARRSSQDPPASDRSAAAGR